MERGQGVIRERERLSAEQAEAAREAAGTAGEGGIGSRQLKQNASASLRRLERQRKADEERAADTAHRGRIKSGDCRGPDGARAMAGRRNATAKRGALARKLVLSWPKGRKSAT